MINKIESKGMQVFNVPNTEEGNAFRKQLSSYLNKPQYKICNRGRGSRKEYGDDSSIPLKHSEWIAVYIDGANIRNVMSTAFQNERKAREATEMVARLRIEAEANKNEAERTIKALQMERESLKDEISVLKYHLDEADATIKELTEKASESHSKAITDDAEGMTVAVISVGGKMIRIEGATSIIVKE